MSRKTTEKSCVLLWPCTCTARSQRPLRRVHARLHSGGPQRQKQDGDSGAALGFPRAAAYLRFSSQASPLSPSECYRETRPSTTPWPHTGHRETQYQPPRRYSYKTKCKPIRPEGRVTGTRYAAALPLQCQGGGEGSHQARRGWICLRMGRLAGIFHGTSTCWRWHIAWQSVECRLQI